MISLVPPAVQPMRAHLFVDLIRYMSERRRRGERGMNENKKRMKIRKGKCLGRLELSVADESYRCRKGRSKGGTIVYV